MITHERIEKSFAKKTRRKIDTSERGKSKHAAAAELEEDFDKPPEDSEDEANDSDTPHEDSDGEVPEVSGRSAKKQAALLAEQHLCELTSKIIFAILGGAIRDSKVKERLMLNRTKLGKSYSTLLAYLDEKKDKKPRPKGKTAAAAAGAAGEKPKAAAKQPVSAQLVLSDDDIEDEEEQEQDDDEEGQRQRELEDDVEEDGEDEEDNDAGAGNGVPVVEDEIMGD